MHFCNRLLIKEPKEKGKAPAMIVFCAFEQIPTVIEYGKKHGFNNNYPIFFIKNYSSQVLKANMKIVGATEYAVVLYRDKLPKFNNGRQIDPETGKPIRGTGKTNHLLINKVMEYPKSELVKYFIVYEAQYHKRYGKWLTKQWKEFEAFNCEDLNNKKRYIDDWHTKEYLRSNMANLWEKHFMGIGKSRITDEEWARLCEGYEKITGEKYQI